MTCTSTLGSAFAFAAELSIESKNALTVIDGNVPEDVYGALEKRWSAIKHLRCKNVVDPTHPPAFSETFKRSSELAGRNWEETQKKVEQYAFEGTSFSREMIEEINRILTRDLPFGWEAPGKYRKIVEVNDGLFLPDQVEPGMEWLVKRLNEGLARHENPIHVASVAWQGLITIHPFSDGNGRTAISIINLILRRHGYSTVTFETIEDVSVGLNIHHLDPQGNIAPLVKITEALEKALAR